MASFVSLVLRSGLCNCDLLHFYRSVAIIRGTMETIIGAPSYTEYSVESRSDIPMDRHLCRHQISNGLMSSILAVDTDSTASHVVHYLFRLEFDRRRTGSSPVDLSVFVRSTAVFIVWIYALRTEYILKTARFLFIPDSGTVDEGDTLPASCLSFGGPRGST